MNDGHLGLGSTGDGAGIPIEVGTLEVKTDR